MLLLSRIPCRCPTLRNSGDEKAEQVGGVRPVEGATGKEQRSYATDCAASVACTFGRLCSAVLVNRALLSQDRHTICRALVALLLRACWSACLLHRREAQRAATCHEELFVVESSRQLSSELYDVHSELSVA